MKNELNGIFDKKQFSQLQKLLIIYEIANNHNGDVNQGLKIIRELSEVSEEFRDRFIFGFKFQYRDLDSFIHPDYQNRKDIKYVKRFSETRLKEEEFLQMREELDKIGFISVCTPFDEKSVDLIEKQNFDILKIASCSFTDWPLLERIVQSNKPVIASTAGNCLEDIDKITTFFSNRNKKFALMHCVAEYPTENSNLQLNQINLLQGRYPRLTIGFSTHERPDNIDSVRIAVAKGARILEKHVAVGNNRNAYSANSEQVRNWLISATESLEMMGISDERVCVSEKEKQDLRGLRRAVFAKDHIKIGESLKAGENIFYAIPGLEGQILTNDLSKYVYYYAQRDINPNEPLLLRDLKVVDSRELIRKIVHSDISSLLSKANLPLGGAVDLELSHHYGVDDFYKFGCTIINLINRDYCKKYIIVLPGQTNPTHTHKLKEESFIVDYGDVIVNIDGEEKEYKRGEIMLVQRGQKHSFSSKNGGIFEEISTTHYKNDSFYEDERIMKNLERKTYVRLWLNND